MPLVLSGDGAVGPLSATEVSYLDGVTSAVQTQINGKYTTGGEWSSWTPTLSNLTLGNGTLAARYVQIGKLILFRIKFTFGSTSSISGSPSFTLPVNAQGSEPISGAGVLLTDAGTSYPTPGAAVTTQTTCIVRSLNTAGTYIGVADMSSTVPWTWAVNDSIAISGFYEAA